jgi:hypothetical protein
MATFDVLTFAEMVGLLKAHACTGQLHVRTGALSANLFLDRGWLVGMDLGDRLMSSADDGMDALLEACCEMLDGDRGVSEFVPATVASTNGLRLDIDAVLDSARGRMGEWRLIRAAIPSVDHKPRLVTTLPGQTVTLDQNRWQLILTIDGRRSVASLARVLGLGSFELRRRLKDLLDERIVELDAGLPRVPFDGQSARGDRSPDLPAVEEPAPGQAVNGPAQGHRPFWRKKAGGPPGQEVADAADGKV